MEKQCFFSLKKVRDILSGKKEYRNHKIIKIKLLVSFKNQEIAVYVQQRNAKVGY